MTDEKQDGLRAEEPTPRKGEDELRPEAPSEAEDFFDKDEHDGWAPIRRRVEEPEPPV